MPEQSFSLSCFPSSDEAGTRFSISGTASRQGSLLAIDYLLVGDPADLIIVPQAAAALRRDELWKTTCFECFWTIPAGSGYWECNISPAGHWNVYRFTDYRQGMEPEERIAAPTFLARRHNHSLQLDLRISLENIISPSVPLSIGIAVILEHRSGALSYWALQHRGPRPDFHRREDFVLVV